jgi:2,3-bisphosphoglycerate-independent phosphoglycerate mutase
MPVIPWKWECPLKCSNGWMAFLKGILESFDYEKDILLMISDHGNIEDLSVKTHTMNPVPLIVVGKQHPHFSSRIKNLTHITPAVISYFTTR